MPFPIPVIVRPIINWAVALLPFIEDTWTTTPMIMIMPPRIICDEFRLADVLFSPSFHGESTYSFPSPSTITKPQNEHRSQQTSDFIYSSHKTLIYGVVFRFWEVGVERVGRNDAGHDSLVITKEEEARCCYG